MKRIIPILMLIVFCSCTIKIAAPEPEQPEPDTGVPAAPAAWHCYLPFAEGGEWTYDVVYKQTQPDYNLQITYTGAETWTCTRANWQDSIFVFGSTFKGSRHIVEGEQQQTDTVSSRGGWFQVRIRNRRLHLLREGSDTLYPFAGELLAGLADQFIVVFPKSDTDIKTIEHPGESLSVQYTLDSNRGVMSAGWEDARNKCQFHLK